ncbi:MAG: hypothetical protein HY671_00060 [Chloroflexi bacterium]|nr:hypothetical protein [Chloroflexota bacterium]
MRGAKGKRRVSALMRVQTRL